MKKFKFSDSQIMQALKRVEAGLPVPDLCRAKAADDTADELGDQTAADLLGQYNASTTQRHYLRRGEELARHGKNRSGNRISAMHFLAEKTD